MVKRFEDLYYESDTYGELMEGVYELRDRLSLEIDSNPDLTELVTAFWEWAQKAEKIEKEAYERGETNFDGDEEYEAGRNYRWVIRDMSDIKKLDGHLKEKGLLESYESFYKEHYKD